MRPRVVRAISGLVITALLAALIWGRPAAGEELNHAGLVVRHGDGRITYAYVAFPEESISGIELLKRSGIPVVTTSFGGLGEGVCSLDSEGCPVSECRQRVCQGPGDESPYWRYFRQSIPGDWRALALGASSTKVRDGDVDGWSWTPDEAFLPPVTLDDLHNTLEISTVNGTPQMTEDAVLTTIYPEGVSPPDEDDRQSVTVYAAAGAVLLLICFLAVFFARRGRLAGVGDQ